MKIYHYSKFLFSILFRKWSFWITTGLYILLLILFWYVFPIILQLDIFELSTYKGIVMLLVLFLAIASITITIQIFRTGIDDGTDLLVISKPISRVEMMWSKLITLILTNLIVSCLACFVTIWVIFSPYDEYKTGKYFILSAFIGTLINTVFWSSITIVFAILFKKFAAFILVIGLQACLIVISLVCSLVVVSPGGALIKNDNISFSGIAVLSKKDANNNVEYDWGVVPVNCKNFDVINQNTKYKNQTLKQEGVNMSTLVQQIYSYGESLSNDSASKAIDLDFQLSMLLTFITNNELDQLNANSIVNGQHSILEKMAFNGGIPISYSLSFSNQPKRNITNDQRIESIKIKNTDFILTANSSTEISSKKEVNNEFYKSTSISDEAFGVLKHNFDVNDMSFPIYELNDTKTNFALKNFTNVRDFAEYYYGLDQMKKFNEFFDAYFNNSFSSKYYGRPRTYYETLMSIYTVEKYDYKPNKGRPEIIHKYLDPLASMLIDFQYATYLALKDAIQNPNEYTWLNSQSLDVMKSVLKCGESDFTNNQGNFSLNKSNWFNKASVFVGNLKEFGQYMTEKQSSTYINDLWKNIQAPLTLVPSINLESFATVKLINSYNITALLLSYSFVSLVILATGLNIYLRKDIA